MKAYDAYNEKARDIYWEHLNKGLFSKGIDAWWTDSTEPDHLDVQKEILIFQQRWELIVA